MDIFSKLNETEQLKEVTNDEVIGLYDIGEESVLAFIKVTDEVKFKKNIKQFIRIVEKKYYNFSCDWIEMFEKILNKCKDLGFKQTEHRVLIDRVFIMQDIAPHYEYIK